MGILPRWVSKQQIRNKDDSDKAQQRCSDSECDVELTGGAIFVGGIERKWQSDRTQKKGAMLDQQLAAVAIERIMQRKPPEDARQK